MPWRVTELCTLKNRPRHILHGAWDWREPLREAIGNSSCWGNCKTMDSPIISIAWIHQQFHGFVCFPQTSLKVLKSALHLNTHQVIIFLQAGSRWQTWRSSWNKAPDWTYHRVTTNWQNSEMEIWASWSSSTGLAVKHSTSELYIVLLYLALRIAFTWQVSWRHKDDFYQQC